MQASLIKNYFIIYSMQQLFMEYELFITWLETAFKSFKHKFVAIKMKSV